MVLQSTVPEVDEEDDEKVADTLSVVFSEPEESPKTFKNMLGLIEYILVSVHYLVLFYHSSHLKTSLTGCGIPDATQC